MDVGIIDGEGITTAELAFCKAFECKRIISSLSSLCKGIFYYLEYRSGSTTTLSMEYRSWNIVIDWMELETCCTLI